MTQHTTAGTANSAPPSATILVTASLAVVALGTSAVVDMPFQLVYNPSDSAPRGWYLRAPARTPGVGTLVLLRLPPDLALFAEERRYLPISVPILKRIAATSGDHVCEQHGTVRINGHLVAIARTHDGAGRPLAAWQSCRTLRSEELFVLNTTSPNSFDSRYFGPLSSHSVLGKAIPLATRDNRQTDIPRRGAGSGLQRGFWPGVLPRGHAASQSSSACRGRGARSGLCGGLL